MKQSDKQVEVTDARKHPFFVVDNDLIAVYGPKIGVYGVAVYNVLAYYSNKKDMAWPSYQTIADHLDMSRPKVVSTIDGLIACGLVRKEHRYSASGDMTSNNYILVSIHGEGSKQDLPPSKPDEPPSKPDEPPSKQDLPPGSKPHSTRGKRRIQEQDPMNKTHILEQERKGNDAPSASPPFDALSAVDSLPTDHKSEQTSKPFEEFIEELCLICHGHKETTSLTEKDIGTLRAEGKKIRAAGFTVADLRDWMVHHWFKDWRWKKDQQRPTPAQVRSSIAKVRAEMDDGAERVKFSQWNTEFAGRQEAAP